MRLNARLASLILSYIALLGQVHAESEVKQEQATTTSISRPTFTVSIETDVVCVEHQLKYANSSHSLLH